MCHFQITFIRTRPIFDQAGKIIIFKLTMYNTLKQPTTMKENIFLLYQVQIGHSQKKFSIEE